jgi:hypothetical protein
VETTTQNEKERPNEMSFIEKHSGKAFIINFLDSENVNLLIEIDLETFSFVLLKSVT